jgi:hypothetical protein
MVVLRLGADLPIYIPTCRSGSRYEVIVLLEVNRKWILSNWFFFGGIEVLIVKRDHYLLIGFLDQQSLQG